MYQRGSECTCQTRSASEEQGKTFTNSAQAAFIKGISALQHSQSCQKLFHPHPASGDKATKEVSALPKVTASCPNFHSMLTPGNNLTYRIAAGFIYIHNPSILDLFPSTVETAWYKSAPSFMKVQSHTQTEVAVLFKEAATCHLAAGSSKGAEHLPVLLHDKSRASSKPVPFQVEAEGLLGFCLKACIGKS